MSAEKILLRDPRTIARDIPGIFDALFPQLAPGLVAHLNRHAVTIGECKPISADLIASSELQHAMLFEIAVAAGQQLVEGLGSIDLEIALGVAIERQRRHFDAQVPTRISEVDKKIIYRVAENLAINLDILRGRAGNAQLVCSPKVPGFQWIASGVGDYALGSQLIEVKCTGRLFSSSDYRQVIMYWLLSYASSIEGRSDEWLSISLLNPRLNKRIELSIDEILKITGGGRSKVDVLELFRTMISGYSSRLLGEV